MCANSAISWKNVYDAILEKSRSCNISYVDSGWKVEMRNSSSDSCKIYSEGEPDMDSLVSVLMRLNLEYPDIHSTYINAGGREYVCCIDDRFQLYSYDLDSLTTLVVSLTQKYMTDLWAFTKKRKALELGEDEGRWGIGLYTN